MISLNETVRNQLGKMTILSALLAISLLHQTAAINLTYIVKKEGETLRPNCIAEEDERYSAIGWVYPLPPTEGNLPGIATKRVPAIRNDFDCKFSKNAKCNKIWIIKNWEIDENSTRTLDLILDSRWEDFPVLFTGPGAKEFEARVEVPNVFRAGFSVRASAGVEILICEGWNPRNYPCYHLNVSKSQIFLRKYASFPQGNGSVPRFVDSYQAFANILSGDEWRNFVVNLDGGGVLRLDDINVNRTVIEYQDKEALKPLYLLVNSQQSALWKLHQNQFFYTKAPQTSRLGPELNLPSKDLCVSFYVSTCPYCALTFFAMISDKKKILKDVEPTREYEWRPVQLQAEQILTNKIYIFVESRLLNPPRNQTEGFWAVDDIRVCHRNEAKVTFLKLKDGDNVTDDVSCQVVQHPKWRPKKLVYSKIEDFPKVEHSSNSTSISLNWTQEDPNNQINYFITYQANDLCLNEPFNLRRIKSNGFLMTKHNEITINNLIPYTKYNITFSSMLHEKEKHMFITTLETDLPVPEELPNRLQIQATDTQAFVSWDQVNCASTYGHIVYSIQVINTDTSMYEDLGIKTGTSIKIENLTPFTLYTLNITTARNFANIQSNKNSFGVALNFTTKPGLAPRVRNLELYSISNDSASFRYDLPKRPKGVPVEVQVLRCNAFSFKKCKSSIQKISRCKLWHRKYCVDIPTLIPNQHYTFKISVRNDHTNIFGNDTEISGVAMHQVPGPPTNITYRFVDCSDFSDRCNLNVSWLHPYNQNGTITAFHIVLNGTTNNDSERIQEILQVPNKTYTRKYEHQIKFIPYSSHYELYIQSVNSIYKSEFANVHVKTADIGEHIDQSPTLQELLPNSAVFDLPTLDHRLSSYTLTTVVQDFDKNKTVPKDILKVGKIADNLCYDSGNTWILPTVEITNDSSTKNYTVGTGNESNAYLKPNTQYCLTFIVTNKYRDTEHDVVYYKKIETPMIPTEEAPTKDSTTTGSSPYKHLYMLVLLLLLVPIGFLVYRYFKKRRPRQKQQENRENVYESLPFEECEENCVNNDTYDHLLHK